MKPRTFFLSAEALLGIMATVQIVSMRQESQTWDEGTHLVSGYSYWRTGDYRLNREHPPLHKLLNALPLLALNPELDTKGADWREARALELGEQFLYHNRVPADTMLFRARLMTVLLTLSLGLVLALWVRSRFGPGAALLSLLFFTFDPSLIAHGRYITSDVCVTLFSFAACLAWGAWLRNGGWWRLLPSGLLLGLALISKFSAAFLFPTFLLLAALSCFQPGRKPCPIRLAGAFLLIWLMAGMVVIAAYPTEARLLVPMALDEGAPKLYEFVSPTTFVGRAIIWFGKRYEMGPHSYLVGLGMLAEHNLQGHPSYLLGQYYEKGHWSYFPIAFAVKTPLGTLAGLLLALVGAVWAIARRRRALLARWRELDFAWVVAGVPLLVYLFFTFAGGINIGVRHLLPVYPFLFALLGAGLVGLDWPVRRAMLGLIAAAVVVESLAGFPYYLAFFNAAVGGPANGPRYLVDSNIDWGQDIKRLKLYVDSRHVDKVCLMYFGHLPPHYYGVNEQHMPGTNDWKDRAEMECPLAAASVTPLMGVYVPRESLAWLRAKQPVAKVGYSIYVYEVTERDKHP